MSTDDLRPIFAVVPAAGRGSRLEINIPKVFVPISPSMTIWDAIRGQVSPVVDEIVLILSPEGSRHVAENPASFSAECFARTRLAVQDEPRGMGDAIFGVAESWRDAKTLLIVWGDQFNLLAGTLRASLDLHAKQGGPAVTIPVVRMERPYVEYIFDSAGRLTAIRQSREGAKCEANGFADMGIFFLTAGPALIKEWNRYQSSASAGAVTGEINFLPFLVHLSAAAGWSTARHECHDPAEALGINTPEDLARAREIQRAKLSSPAENGY